MVSLSNLRGNINTLINKYVYNKNETEEHFDDYISKDIRYFNGKFFIPKVVYNDDSLNDNSYKYYSTSSKATLSYDVTNKYYTIRNMSGSVGFGTVKFNNLKVGNHCILRMKVMIPSQSVNIQARLSLFNNNTDRGVGVNFCRSSTSNSEFGIRENLQYNAEGNSSGFVSNSNTISYGVWYTVELIVDGDEFFAYLYNNDGSLNRSLYKNISGIIDSTDNGIGIQFCYTNNAYCCFKDVEIISIDGEYIVYPQIIADFSAWSGSTPIYSDFVVPNNHEITVSFKSSPNIQVACSDLSNNWIYAQNIGFDNSKTFSYRGSSNNVLTKTPSFTLNQSHIYKITYNDDIVKFYVNDELIHKQLTYDTLNVVRKIRIYNNASSIKELMVNEYKPSKTKYSEEDIKNIWTKYSDVSGRKIYKLPLNVDSNETVEIEFKYKTIDVASGSYASVIGIDLFGNNNYSIKCGMVAQTTTTITPYYSASSSNRNKYGTDTSFSVNNVFRIIMKKGNDCYWYKDDVLIAHYAIERSATATLRYDIFDNNPSELEYLKIKV